MARAYHGGAGAGGRGGAASAATTDDAPVDGPPPGRLADARRRARRDRAGGGQWNLFPHLTAFANITLAPRVVRAIKPAVAEGEARALLGRVGLGDRGGACPHELSGGQQQRVAIARALAQAPEVLLFDEPTSALDPEMTDEVVAVRCDLAGAGMTMLVVTHEMRVATELATRVWVIDRGTIVEDGAPAELVASARSQVARDYFGRR